MSINPYQAPDSFETAIEGRFADPTNSVAVDGKSLVVRSGVVLPAVCVKTNQPVSARDMVTRTLTWCSPLVMFLILLGGLPLILGYLIVRRHCKVTFRLDRSVRWRYRKRLAIKLLVVVGSFLAIPLLSSSDVLIFVAAAVFLCAVVSLFIGNSPLRAVDHHRGSFWIKGCSEEYLLAVQNGSCPFAGQSDEPLPVEVV